MAQQQTIESDLDSEWSFFDWIQANTRALSIGAAIVLVGGLGYWFYLRSAEIKRLNAERGLNQAKQALAAGNAALAQTDLQRVATRYTGTPAGAQSAMILAQLNYEQGKFDEGVKVLQPYQSGSAAGPSLSAIWALTGDGQVSAGKPADGASSYQRAAESTPLPGERSIYLSRAAKALMSAGKNADARAIWERLISDPDALPVRNEARIRLGELTAQPAGKS